ncbi:MAG: hypothetical protein M3R61_13870, partial [Chloroflexota bacterium]|nr:hypothetical protein [Chloroflexota bacterium]
MPLVFVHGVNTRRGDTPEQQKVYDNGVAFMSEQFRNAAFAERVKAANGLTVFTPYWGDLGVTFARKLACLPQDGVESLAIDQPEARLLLEVTAANLDPEVLLQSELRSAPLVTLARTRSLGAAVDLLFAGATNAPVPDILLGSAELKQMLPEAARFADAAERYAAANPHPAWLADVSGDDTFLDQLLNQVQAFPTDQVPGAPASAPTDIQSLGISSDLKTWLDTAVSGVRNAVGSVVGAASGSVVSAATPDIRAGFRWVSGFVRPAASAFVGQFFGDVFTYLEHRQPIIDRVLSDIDKAVAAKRVGDNELYLVGHSFGGIILYDILTFFRPELECDLYVTVGSQVGLFAEIGRLANKAAIAQVFATSANAVVPR